MNPAKWLMWPPASGATFSVVPAAVVTILKLNYRNASDSQREIVRTAFSLELLVESNSGGRTQALRKEWRERKQGHIAATRKGMRFGTRQRSNLAVTFVTISSRQRLRDTSFILSEPAVKKAKSKKWF
jgi:hypothetical protein